MRQSKFGLPVTATGSTRKIRRHIYTYVGIYVHKTFVRIVYILLIAYYHIINELKMYVAALAGLCVLSLRFILFQHI